MASVTEKTTRNSVATSCCAVSVPLTSTSMDAYQLAEWATVERPPKLEGRSMIMFLAPVLPKEAPKKDKKADAAPEKAEKPGAAEAEQPE